MKNIKIIVDCSIVKFLIVGIVNTLLGFACMMFLYTLLDLGYWISTALTYLLGNILSFILNRSLTFNYSNNSYKIKIKFTVNVVICYLVAYGFSYYVVKPYILSCFTKEYVLKFIMVISIGFYTILNYAGQRFWVFR